MMFKQTIALLLCGCLPTSLAAQPVPEKPVPVSLHNTLKYVDPFIGTGGHGHTYPGATAPFGMVQLSPDGDTDGWDWSSGYHHSDTTLMGFSHTHFSGTGIGDLGDVSLMPTVGKLVTTVDKKKTLQKGYRSNFSHQHERAEAGYYAVRLDDYHIEVELTATERAGFHRYTFPASDSVHILINLQTGIGWDWCTDASLTIENDTTVTGMRRSSGWAPDQVVYFAARFSKPFQSCGVATDSVETRGARTARGKNVRAFLNYRTAEAERILVKVGISAVSIDNARQNLDAEIPHWDFERTKQETQAKWNAQLNRIELEGDEKEKRIFYTALYHLMLAPTLYTDIDSTYRGMDKQPHRAQGFTNYTVFSLWDTFRAAHPFFTLVSPERVGDFVRSLMAAGEEQGALPVWTFASNETNTMIGYHALSVIAEAYLKGFRGFDAARALELMQRDMMQNRRGSQHYRKFGYIPFDKDGSSVAQTLEYAYDDWCAAQLAQALGKSAEAKEAMRRSQFYRNVIDEDGFARGKDSLGKWRTPFDPRAASHWGNDFVEGNAWQYTWFMPHDVQGYLKRLGRARFLAKLDSFFTVQEITGDAPPDISGRIGQYAHGNEPSHHAAYLYAVAGAPHRTEELVRHIKTTLYTDAPGGLTGNDDCGQLSAWYLFSALGFYPVNPASGVYELGAPTFRKAVLQLPQGKRFTVEAKNISTQNFYVKSVSLNGKRLRNAQGQTGNTLTHRDIVRGGTLVFDMTDVPPAPALLTPQPDSSTKP